MVGEQGQGGAGRGHARTGEAAAARHPGWHMTGCTVCTQQAGGEPLRSQEKGSVCTMSSSESQTFSKVGDQLEVGNQPSVVAAAAAASSCSGHK